MLKLYVLQNLLGSLVKTNASNNPERTAPMVNHGGGSITLRDAFLQQVKRHIDIVDWRMAVAHNPEPNRPTEKNYGGGILMWGLFPAAHTGMLRIVNGMTGGDKS
ncbi:hypothetical protein GOODEAATRI_006007 [Goodea atripinnis]|uniref:Uncharacterized protein n=1 Tax=Goodea atripinnis TaxID=208336 RepID=A0ABV0PVP6_9TELE